MAVMAALFHTSAGEANSFGVFGFGFVLRSLCFVGASIIIIAFPLLAFRFSFEAGRVRNDFSRFRGRAG